MTVIMIAIMANMVGSAIIARSIIIHVILDRFSSRQ